MLIFKTWPGALIWLAAGLLVVHPCQDWKQVDAKIEFPRFIPEGDDSMDVQQFMTSTTELRMSSMDL